MPHYVKVEVEVESEADLREAIACGADVIMLDNQDLESLRRLVRVARELDPKVVLEASGGVTLGDRAGGGRDRGGPHLHQRSHHGGTSGGRRAHSSADTKGGERATSPEATAPDVA